LLGLVVGAVVVAVAGLIVGGPFALTHRQDLPFERIYGDVAIGIASRLFAGSAQNPLASNPRAVEQGRSSYIGSCAECHGATGDGKGVFGQSTYPPAADLTSHDTKEKSDASLFWIVKNGLSFTGMPGFSSQYNDQEIWALVSYMRSMQPGQVQLPAVPAPTADQLSFADPAGDAAHRGAAVYFAQGCASCHGAVGNAPGELGLRRTNGNELTGDVRRGPNGMPSYSQAQISDADLANLAAYTGTFPQQAPGRGGDRGEGLRPGNGAG
jgi:mono/diheme cytochrome c family protein